MAVGPLGTRIEQLMNELNLSYRELAERVLAAGGDITENTISNLVKGMAPTLATLYSLSLGLLGHVTFIELLELAGIKISMEELVTELSRQLDWVPEPRHSKIIHRLCQMVEEEKEKLAGAVQNRPWVIDPLLQRPSAEEQVVHVSRERGLRLEVEWHQDVLHTKLTVRVIKMRYGDFVPNARIVLFPNGKDNAGIEKITQFDGTAEFNGLVSARQDRFRLEIYVPQDDGDDAIAGIPTPI